MSPGAPTEQNCRNIFGGVFVVGNPVCFATSIMAGPVLGFPQISLSTLKEPGAPKEQKLLNTIVGVFVVGNPVCFAKSIVGVSY